MMQAGEADYWRWVYQPRLVEKGFVVLSSWAGAITHIWPNTVDPNSKWNDIRLRHAIEYAIDKQAISESLGSDFFLPMKMPVPPGEWGYDPIIRHAIMILIKPGSW